MTENSGNVGNGTKVVSIQNGRETAFDFDGNTPLMDVVKQVASRMGYGAVLVSADGRNVEPNEGTKPVNSFQRVEIVPKFSGAMW
jgi:hypothetical protein